MHHSSEPRGRQGSQTGLSPPTKTCSRCGTAKPHTEFFPNRNARDGLQSYCKACHNEARRKGGQVGRPRKASDVLPLSVHFFDQLPGEALLGADAVAILVNLAPRSIATAVRDGRLPAPRIEGGQRVWTVGQIRAHLAAGGDAERRVGVLTLGRIIRHARQVLGAARVNKMIAEARAEVTA